MIAAQIEATNFSQGMGPQTAILTGSESVTAVPAIISGSILIARDPGSNQNSIGVITSARPTASNQNSTDGITIVRRTGMGLNFGAGVIGRSTGMVTPAASTGGLTIPW